MELLQDLTEGLKGEDEWLPRAIDVKEVRVRVSDCVACSHTVWDWGMADVDIHPPPITTLPLS